MSPALRLSAITISIAGFLSSAFVLTATPIVNLVAASVLIYALSHTKQHTNKQFYKQSYLFGLVYFAIVMAWIYHIKATDLIPNNALAFAFKALTFLLVMSALSTGFLLAAWLYRKLKININGRSALLLPAVWVVGEYFRSVFFSGFSMGRGGSFGPYWSFGTLGLSVDHPLLYAGRIVGMYGLSFLIILIALVLVRLMQRRYRWALLLVLPISLSIAGWLVYRQPTGPSIQVNTVALGAETDTGYEQRLTAQLTSQPPAQLTVLPEYSNYFVNASAEPTKNKLPLQSGLIIDSRLGTAEQGHKNILTFYKPDGTILAEQEKSFLIPAGEFVPYLYAGILVYSGNASVLRSIQADHGVYKAAAKESPFLHQGVRYGSLACSGAIAPNLYAHLAKQGADILTNSASISTLGVSDLYYQQAEQMSRFIAVSNAKPFVQAARGGPSYILNKDGGMQQFASSPAELALLRSQVTINQTTTLYSRLGEFMVGLSSIMILIRFTHYQRKARH